MKFVWNHPANGEARTRALCRAARFQARGRIMRKRTLARLGERSSVWAELHRRGASKVVYGNPPDHPEMLVWREWLRPGDLFVDVGANVGSYSIWAAETGAEVIALEPAADTFALLEENIALNGYRIRAVRAAAGRSGGTVRMSDGLDTVNRISPAGEVEVDMVTLDSLVGERVTAGAKIDVEGFEIEVLRGWERALSEQRVRLIQLEWGHATVAAMGTDCRPVADLLARHGYRLCRPRPDGVLVPLTDVGFGADVFALPE